MKNWICKAAIVLIGLIALPTLPTGSRGDAPATQSAGGANDAQVIGAFEDRLAKLKNFRVEYTESRNVTPPGVDPDVGATVEGSNQPGSFLPPGMIGKVVHGKYDANCIFAVADATHCMYQRELTAETADRLRNQKDDGNSFEQTFCIGDNATRFVVFLDGDHRRYDLRAYHGADFEAGMDVNLGLRLLNANQVLDGKALANATVSGSDGNLIIAIPGQSETKTLLTIDPSKGYAVVKIELKAGPELIADCVCDQFDEVMPGLFLPKHAITRGLYDNGQKESQRCEFKVQRYDIGHELLSSYRGILPNPPQFGTSGARPPMPTTSPDH